MTTVLTPPIISVVSEALRARRYTKLIVGASFTELAHVEALVRAYCHTGIAMVDVAADLAVVETAARVLAEEGCLDRVGLMVSFPLDADPHFRKIAFDEAACINCEACIPTCPTTVFSMPNTLAVETPLCYGCGRCLPVCPTDALSLEPFSVMAGLQETLAHPAVSAVEIHSTYADAALVETLYADMGTWLADKLVSVCFRPQQFSVSKSLAFIEAFESKVSVLPVILQVDGQPMSATSDLEASLPALEAARQFAPHLASKSHMALTVSGGINAHTAKLLHDPVHDTAYTTIQGVGLGTAARTWIWEVIDTPQLARETADTLIAPFLSAFQVDKNSV